jgi:hypothetical protein
MGRGRVPATRKAERMKELMKLCWLLTIFTLLGPSAFATPSAKADSSSTLPKPDWKYVEKRLKQNGFKKPFISALKDSYEPAELKDVLELNVLLFLKKTDYHGVQITDEAVKKIQEFVVQNDSALHNAESAHGVPPSIVASLMWIESRYGKNLGRFNVASVYADLVQADRPEVVKYLQKDGAHRFAKKISKSEIKKIAERAKKKAKWAIGELKALQKINAKGQPALEFRGSFAGAFGMPQFLPSSYARWAKAAGTRKEKAPDLTLPEDAIQSVAFYLKDNGWRKKRAKTHMRALMNYNNSKDYANAILELASRAEASAAASTRAPSAASLVEMPPSAPARMPVGDD